VSNGIIVVAKIDGCCGFAPGIGGGERVPSGVHGDDGAWSEAFLVLAMTPALMAK
jgi:hypothetical protein